MSKLKDRFKEPSTYAGLSSIVIGAGLIGKANEAPAIADAITNATPALIAGDWWGALMIALGSLAIVLKEKASK